MADKKNEEEAKVTKTTAEKIEGAAEVARKDAEERLTPASISPAKSSNIEASGAIMEPAVKSAIDVDHPAVDNNPRAGTTERQNKVDFNDPTLKASDAVQENLDAQR